MDVQANEMVSNETLIQDIIEHTPNCTEAQLIMPQNYSFSDKLITIMLHSQDCIAFARSHNNKFLIDFLNYNQLIWEKNLKISINIVTTNFTAFSGPQNITYFVSLNPSTFVIRFNEDTWKYEIYHLFDKQSKASFINENFIYILIDDSIYCADLNSNIDEILESHEMKIKANQSKESDIIQEKESIPDNLNSAEIISNSELHLIPKLSNIKNNFNHIKIFATQQFDHFNLIYTNNINSPLFIFDTLTNSFCNEKELIEVASYFKRKPSSVYPLPEAKFMPVPSKSNCFFLFHDFDSSQNTFIPFNSPLVIPTCQNKNNEPLTIITVSVKRISPIISMFTLPGEGFNFLSIPSHHYYQFYTSCGLLSIINHSKSIISSYTKQKIYNDQDTKNQVYSNLPINGNEKMKPIDANFKILNNAESLGEDRKTDHDVKIIETKSAPFSPPILTPINALDFIHDSKNSQLQKKEINTISNQNENLQFSNQKMANSNLDETPNQVNISNSDISLQKTDKCQIYHEKQAKISAIIHYLSLGPVSKVNLPNIEIDICPEYRFVVTTPHIPHCIFLKSVEVIISCAENNDILSFYLKPSSCIIPQRVEVKCKPNTTYKVRVKVSNGFQNTFSDTIEFTTPNPGIPPKVEDFFGTYVADNIYIFKWNPIPDVFCVNNYILEGLRKNPLDKNTIDFDISNIDDDGFLNLLNHESKNTNGCSLDDLCNPKISSGLIEDGFEFIIDLASTKANSDLYGAKLKISNEYSQFRLRASNSAGIGLPSDPCTVIKKENIHLKKENQGSPRINLQQVQYLNDFYEQNPRPNVNERNEIASLLSLSYKTVNSWFARKRHTDKMNGKQVPKQITNDES